MLRTIDFPTLLQPVRRGGEKDFYAELEKRRQEIAEAKKGRTTVRSRNEGGAIFIGFYDEE